MIDMEYPSDSNWDSIFTHCFEVESRVILKTRILP